MIQLCVAMVQDLGLSKNPQDMKKKLALGESGGIAYTTRALAEKRAFLGTFYLTACALLCRVNNYFSYDDIENAEVKGESLLQLSATNFESELARLAESIPPAIKESNLHSSLWNPSPKNSAVPISATRLKVLCRCLDAMKSYVNTILSVPKTSLHHLAFPTWSGWCYATIIACKLVFLEDNERDEQTEITPTFAEVTRLVMDKSLFAEPRPCSLPTEPMSSTWNPISVAKEAGVLTLFHQMYDKMKYTLPEDPDAWEGDHCSIDPLSRIAYFQRNLLCSFTNRLNEHITKITNSGKTVESANDANTGSVARRENWVAPQPEYARERLQRAPIPLMQNLHFNSMNFDSIAPMENLMPQEGSFSDWLWNTAMDDFTMPPL
ncbi:hypothetical protein N0V90_004373 [Kalmusia sp. IMI 367209]|nr:hypothetical protein N0V90_004373 [Kalmusia sp. IMI 367209]